MHNQQYMTVSQLNYAIRQLIENSPTFNPCWVEGEISNCKIHSSGHIYFTLKDEASSIRCVMFRGRSQHLKFRPNNGMKVLVLGTISVYEREGQYQLYAQQMEPQGQGALAVAFAQLKEKLESEGLFAAERKQQIPKCPLCVGVVTSPTGAAIRDMINVMTRRFPGIRIILAPVLVQGVEAPQQIVKAIKLLNQIDDVEVIIVGRGGGSIEELWAFNEEMVARGIAQSAKPIISAVGHETDFTIADMVADLRAPTPSAAAELVVPDIHQLLTHVDQQEKRLQMAMGNMLRRLQERVAYSQERLGPDRLLSWVAYRERELAQLHTRLNDAGNRLVQGRQQQLRELMRALHALSPLATLNRGYAICRRLPGDHVVDSIGKVLMGDTLSITVADGQIESRVLGTSAKE